MRFGFFDFTRVFIPKPVPTFERPALVNRPRCRQCGSYVVGIICPADEQHHDKARHVILFRTGRNTKGLTVVREYPGQHVQIVGTEIGPGGKDGLHHSMAGAASTLPSAPRR